MLCVSVLAARLTLILGAEALKRLITLPWFFCDHSQFSQNQGTLSGALVVFGHTSPPRFNNVISVWKWEELSSVLSLS